MLYRQRRMLLLPSQPGRDCHNAIYTPGTSNVSSTYVCERLIDSTTPTDYPAQRLRCPGKSRVAGAHGAALYNVNASFSIRPPTYITIAIILSSAGSPRANNAVSFRRDTYGGFCSDRVAHCPVLATAFHTISKPNR